MTMHVRVSGAWKEVAAGGGLSVRVSGAWKTVAAGYVRVAGAWKQFYQNALYALPTSAGDIGFLSGTGSAQATVNMLSNGTFTTGGANDGLQESGNWVTPTALAPGGYTIRAHVDSGATPTGSAVDTDLALSSNRSWSITQSGAGSLGSSLTLTLKDSGGNTVASGSCLLDVEVLPF